MMQPVVIRLPDEERRLLQLEARSQNLPVSAVARKAIKKYLKKSPKQLSGVEVLLKWATRAKKYESKYKDKKLSANYKKYLYGSQSPKFGYLWRDKKK